MTCAPKRSPLAAVQTGQSAVFRCRVLSRGHLRPLGAPSLGCHEFFARTQSSRVMGGLLPA